jgi:large subunit ribosomal protein L10
VDQLSTTLERPSLKRKTLEVQELTELIGKYDAVLIANLHKVRSIQLQELSKKFRGTVLMKVAKNSTLRRAIETSSKPEIAALKDSSTGSNVLLLTNMNPFQLSILLDRSKVKIAAKTGDIAPDDIIVPAGNTGLPPGPAISELNEAGIRTRIESGSVYVLRDTVVAKKGEAVQPRVASVLSKLGIKPLEVGLSLKAAYEGGIFLKESDLHIDLEAVKRQFEEGFGQALALSVNTAFLTSETATSILSNAHRNGLSLALSANYPTAETITSMLGKGYSRMVILSNMLAKVNPENAPPKLGGAKEKS